MKNFLSHYCKLRDYHYPSGFHHVVSALLTLWCHRCYWQLTKATVSADLVSTKYLSSQVTVAFWMRRPLFWETSTKMQTFSAPSLYLACGGRCHGACCIVSLGVSCCLSGRVYLWKCWMTKTQWDFSTSLHRGELMRRYYPFFFVLIFSTLFEEKLVEGKELLERNSRLWQRLHHRRSHSCHHYRKFTSQTFSASTQRGTVAQHKKTHCFRVWLKSESCQCEDLNFCLYIQPWNKILKILLVSQYILEHIIKKNIR